MTALRLSISAVELTRRLRERLLGAAPETSARVVWQRDGESVLVNAASLTARFLDGWLLCNLDLQTNQTGRQTLQVVYFLGARDRGAGLQAACTINAPTPGASQIAAAWGAELQRVLWDAVLDAIELAVYHAESLRPHSPLSLAGFHCTARALVIDVLPASR
jgi:hypothetical protein